MPTLTLVIVASSQIVRMTRATVLNVMSSPYIEMAVLKGVPRKRIILRHALLNAIGPIVNVVALNLAYLVGSVVIVETIFAYGFGQADRRRTNPRPAAGPSLRHDFLCDLHLARPHRRPGFHFVQPATAASK